MSEITDRLRERVKHDTTAGRRDGDLLHEAADRIEALEAALRRQMARYPISSLDYQDAAKVLMGHDK